MMVELLSVLALVLLAIQVQRRPWEATLLLIVLLPSYLIRFSILGTPTTFLETAIWLAAILYLVKSSNRSQVRAALQNLPTTVVCLVLIFIVAAVISTGISDQLRVSLGIMKGWIITPLILAALIYVQATTAKHRQQVLEALVVSSTAVSIIALVAGPVAGRLKGIYDVPNSLALYVAPILTATTWLAITRNRFRTWHVGAITIQAAAVLGSQSVAAVGAIGIALAIGTLTWLSGKKRHVTGAGLVLTLIAAIIIFLGNGKIAYLLEPLHNPATHNSATVRLQLWSISWELIKAQPLLGVGLGQFEPAYQEALHQRLEHNDQLAPEFVFRDPHNWILSFWLNTGLMGLIAFGALVVVVVQHTWRSRNAVPLAYILLLLTSVLFGLVDTIYWKNDLASVWWIAVSVLIRESRPSTNPSLPLIED